MELLIDLLIKESSRDKYKETDIREYTRKRNKINYLAKELGYTEKRDGRHTGISGRPFCNMHDKINYCLVYSFDRYKGQIKDEMKISKLSKEQEKIALSNFNDYKSHMQRASDGFEDLRNRILGGNIRLVIKEAKKRCRHNEDLGDFIQEGSAGLLHALSKYKPGMNLRFSTYATYWIRQYIFGFSADNQPTNVIRIPRHIQEHILKLNKGLRKSKTAKEITDLSINDVKRMAKISHHVAENVWRAMRLQKGISLDHQLTEDLTLIDTLKTFDKEHKEIWVDKALNSLDETDRKIIELRYLTSPDGKREHYTLAEVGEELKLSRERVRQREVRILKQLRRYYYKNYIQAQ